MMRLALALARQAADAGEVPVGAVVHDADGSVVAQARNETITTADISAHAEMLALRRAAAVCGNHRLPQLQMTATLEPCPMCAGAIFHARLSAVTYAAADAKTGAFGGVVNLAENTLLNHQTAVCGGLYADESAALLRGFFRERRK